MAWPSTLPLPIANGYGLAPVDPVIRTDMEVGTPRARRRTSARNDKISVVWVFTDAQMAIFRTWFDNPVEAAGGSSWFTLDVALGTGGLVSMDARFAGVWQSSMMDGYNWQVTATLELR